MLIKSVKIALWSILCLFANSWSTYSLAASSSIYANVKIAAHRGDWRHAPENSVAGIASAIQQGADYVEIDVRQTADGYLVLMHDETVDRTTNGSGRVDAMTFAQIRALRLRENEGGESDVTSYQVPTLEEAVNAVRVEGIAGIQLNLDKAWDIRQAVYDTLLNMDALDMGQFKSNADPDEVEAFLDQDARIQYIHLLDDDNAEDFDAFQRHTPIAWEIIFDRLTDAQIDPDVVAQLSRNSQIWINTMWYDLAAGYTDEVSLLHPENGWQAAIERHAVRVIQTDNIPALRSWLDEMAGVTHDNEGVSQQPIRVFATDYGTEGPGYSWYDSDKSNNGGKARIYEGVDFCDQNGNIHMCYIRAGEWVTYQVEIPVTGWYDVSARVSARQQSAGVFSLEFDDEDDMQLVVDNTSAHSLFMLQPIGEKYFNKGTHTMTFRVEPSDNTNFNLQYIQFERQ